MSWVLCELGFALELFAKLDLHRTDQLSSCIHLEVFTLACLKRCAGHGQPDLLLPEV